MLDVAIWAKSACTILWFQVWRVTFGPTHPPSQLPERFAKFGCCEVEKGSGLEWQQASGGIDQIDRPGFGFKRIQDHLEFRPYQTKFWGS